MTGFNPEPIFVFGSNREGRHGKGAALQALKAFGAKYGQAEGLQGRSYAIITKELREGYERVSLEEVKEGVEKFLEFARSHPEMIFQVSPIGCGLAGFKPERIAPMFADPPDNVRLPIEFIDELRETRQDKVHRVAKDTSWEAMQFRKRFSEEV